VHGARVRARRAVAVAVLPLVVALARPVGAAAAEATVDPEGSRIATFAREHRLQDVTCSSSSADASLQWTAVGSFHQALEFIAALAAERPGRCSERLVIAVQRERARHELAMSGTISSRRGATCVAWSRLGALLTAVISSVPRQGWTTTFTQDGDAVSIEGVTRTIDDAVVMRRALQDQGVVAEVQFSVIGTTTEAGEERPRFRIQGTVAAGD